MRVHPVVLVGAGPGDPGLLTVRGREALERAEVVVADRLVAQAILAGAPPDAEVIVREARRDLPQESINELLVEKARAGLRVVRLKGGDPFVFGRGGEEAEALTTAGIPFEVVPGVTSGVAAPAYAGIPVTHREDSSAVAFVAGHEDPSKDGSSVDWEALARFPGTLVLYMGVKRLPDVAARLMAAGRDRSEPAVAVERGTTPQQRTVSASLGGLPEAVTEAGIAPPAIVLIGRV